MIYYFKFSTNKNIIIFLMKKILQNFQKSRIFKDKKSFFNKTITDRQEFKQYNVGKKNFEEIYSQVNLIEIKKSLKMN
jgi:hypothetical protein